MIPNNFIKYPPTKTPINVAITPNNLLALAISIFDHPSNPRYPTWWHARDYGLVAANPFGQHDFEGKPKGSGDMVIKSGEEINFSYRFFFHEGNPAKSNVSQKYIDWSKEKS